MASLALLVLVIGAGAALAQARQGTAGASRGAKPTRFSLANHCFHLRSRTAGLVKHTGDGYRAGARRSAAASFFMKPARLSAYLLYDQAKGLASASKPRIERLRSAVPSAVWAVRPHRGGFVLHSLSRGGRLTARRNGTLTVGNGGSGAAAEFRFVPATGCRIYPEAQLGARGRPFRGTRSNGTVRGFVDSHLHVTADERAGGSVIGGRPYGRLGITRALGGDAKIHGPDGSADVTGNLLRTGLPFGTHDVHGWPTFAGWPVHDTNTHEQVYYRWLQRSWMAGERLVVAQTVEDQAFCRIEPRKRHSCNETATIAREVRELRRLEHYVDAQSGGPGKGWLRLVESPERARRVIERGKLAVVIGVESSDPFNCSEFEGKPACDRADVDRGIARYQRLGISGMFIAHWVNNAFAGPALEGGSKGRFIGAFNALQTGEYFETGACPSPKQGEEVAPLSRGEQQVLVQYFPKTAPLLDKPIPDYPPGRQCNVRGLTKLGRYLVRRLIANQMLIEVDHLSEKAREQVLAIAARHDYPLISSHNGTGGLWTGQELRSLYAHGGYASVTPGQAPELAEKILRMRRFDRHGRYFGVGLGSDTGGFSSLPGPRTDAAAHPLHYPFIFHGVSFRRQRTGKRSFDLNADGVAHYGLFADLLADMRRAPDGSKAMRPFFRSAEAYLQTWQRAAKHR